MSAFQDYLKVLPGSDRAAIEKLIASQVEDFSIEGMTEAEFGRLVERLAVLKEQTTEENLVSGTIEASVLNRFFRHVAIDLLYLFEQQNLIEGAARNYDRIFKGLLDDMRREVEALKRREEELTLEREGESGLFVRSYGFDAAEKEKVAERKGRETNHLFQDRDGRVLEEVSLERMYHQHYAGLPKFQSVDRLKNDRGVPTATVTVDHDARGAVPIQVSGFGPGTIIDDNPETFFMHVVLTEEPATHDIPKDPGRGMTP